MITFAFGALPAPVHAPRLMCLWTLVGSPGFRWQHILVTKSLHSDHKDRDAHQANKAQQAPETSFAGHIKAIVYEKEHGPPH